MLVVFSTRGYFLKMQTAGIPICEWKPLSNLGKLYINQAVILVENTDSLAFWSLLDSSPIVASEGGGQDIWIPDNG